MIQVWIKDKDIKLFHRLVKNSNYSFSPYLENVLTTENIKDPGVLGSMRKKFTVGKIGIWRPRGSNQIYRFVRINNNSMYPDGLILTPYSEIDVDYHLKTRRIDLTTKLERVELLGEDEADIIVRTFKTYGMNALVRKHTEKDHHLLLYRT